MPTALPTIYRLRDEHTKQLLSQPETGMGYQIIQNDESADLLVALNAEWLLALPTGQAPLILPEPEVFESTATLYPGKDLTVLRNPKYDALGLFNDLEDPVHHKLPTGPGPIIISEGPAYPYKTRLGDVYVRFSAYPNDRRISLSGELAPGSYVTTLSDLQVVPSGIAAVGRYALPNHRTARYAYRINPPALIPVHYGTVAPAYGLCGGGVEVLFATGAPAGSVHLFDTIPAM